MTQAFSDYIVYVDESGYSPEKQKAPVYLPELYADWALPIHEHELTQHQSNNQLNLRVL